MEDELENETIKTEVDEPSVCTEKMEFIEELQIKEETYITCNENISIKSEINELTPAANETVVIKNEIISNVIVNDINDLLDKGVEDPNQNTSHLNINFESEPLIIKEELTEIEDTYNKESVQFEKDSINVNLPSNQKESNESEGTTCQNTINEINTLPEINESSKEQNELEADSLNSNELHLEIENNESNASCLPVKFQVNRSAIEMISKENQASELQSLEGLSVYDQTILETGILLQVDQALEKEAPGQSQSDALLEPGEVETEMERQIRLGEMTPFGTSLGKKSTTPALKPIDGLSEIEKYLTNQLELQGQRKREVGIKKTPTLLKNQKIAKPKDKENKHDPLKRRILNRDGKKKKKMKESLGTETEEVVPWTNRPGPVVGEKAYMYPDDASGSEYVPTDSDFVPSSEDEKKDVKIIEKKHKSPANKRKRKLEKRKPYKIPEDWASDDSDWEYSDEEDNLKKNKRSMKSCSRYSNIVKR